MPAARTEIQNLWGAAANISAEADGEHSSILEAVKKAERTLPKARGPRLDLDRDKNLLDKLAEDVGHRDSDSKIDYLSRISELPIVVESVDFPGMSFIEIQHLSHQIIIRLNIRHPFYQDLWQPIREIADAPAGSISGDDATRAARRTIEALTLLIVAYAKAESMNVDPDEYAGLRHDWAGSFELSWGKSRTCCSARVQTHLLGTSPIQPQAVHVLPVAVPVSRSSVAGTLSASAKPCSAAAMSCGHEVSK